MGLSSNGPKSASPAFSGGGHGAYGVGSSGSASSGAPLTPSSARTPTSAPPVTASNGCLPPRIQPHCVHSENDDLFSSDVKTDPTTSHSTSNGLPSEGGLYDQANSLDAVPVTHPPTTNLSVSDPFPTQSNSTVSVSNSTPLLNATLKAEPSNQVGAEDNFAWPSDSEVLANTSHSGYNYLGYTGPPNPDDHSYSQSVLSPSQDTTGNVACTQREHFSSGSCLSSADRNSFPSHPSDQTSDFPNLPTSSLTSHSPMKVTSSTCNAPSLQRTASPLAGSPTDTRKPQAYSFNPSPSSSECSATHTSSCTALATFTDATDTTPQLGRSALSAVKPNRPATAMVTPIVGVPEAVTTLTQEQWENRKSKIAQLEKIHSTLSKSKSASTPGAVAAAAGVVMHQHRLPINGSSAPGPLAPAKIGPQQHADGTVTGTPTGPTSYPPVQRHGIPDSYLFNRGPVCPGLPPSETAQREWDRLCLDYQREKLEPSPQRMHLNCRHAMVLNDSTCCSLTPTDANGPPSAGNIVPAASSVMEQHASCQISPRHFSTHVDGVGPPVVMVPPNNSNITVSSAYSLSTQSSAVSGHNYRCIPTMNCHPDQVPSGAVVMGQKRPYYGSPNDSWSPSVGGALATPQGSLHDSGLFVGSMVPCGTAPTQRTSGLRTPTGSLTSSPTPVPASAVVTSSSTGARGSSVSKTGGKKRKTAGTGRANANSTSTISASCTPLQHPCPYGKTTGSVLPPGSIAFGKSMYPSPYMNDPSQAAFYPHRSMHASASSGHQHMTQPGLGAIPSYHCTDSHFGHYPDMACGLSLGRSLSGSELPLEGRRAMTLKGGEMCHLSLTGGAGVPCGPPLNGGRMSSSNCGMPFPSGPFGNSSVSHAYVHGPEGAVALGCDIGSGMRPAVPYTQHLTSASLASLARLSQLSGPEGSFVPSSTSSSVAGSSFAQTPGSGAYPGRGYPPDGTSFIPGQPQQMPHQSMRGHPVAPSAGLKSYDVDLMSPIMPHSALSPSMHQQKIGSQTYHVPGHQQHTSSQPPQQQQQQPSHQPPSIQVNNTFFNAQLNVQQMNYQHVSAPGSTGQMQIHFVQQQQHEQSGVPMSGGLRCPRPPGTGARVPAGNSGPMSTTPEFYSGQPQLGHHLSTYGSEVFNQRLSSSYSNQPGTCEARMKSELTVPLCTGLTAIPATGGATTSTAGYGSTTSVHITPRTPHTIQYLPATTPSHPDAAQHAPQSYVPSDCSPATRSRQMRPTGGQGSIDTLLFAPPPPDVPISEATTHPSSTIQQHQYQQQQQQLQSQYNSQSISQSAYPDQIIAQNKINQQQQYSTGRPTGSSWSCPSGFALDPGAPGSSMLRPIGTAHHSSSRTAVGQVSGYMSEMAESGLCGPGWTTDPSESSSSQRSGNLHYSRQHSIPPRPDGSSQPQQTQTQQQQLYRQQQFNQHHYHQQQQQQQQQQQMFMSSSLNNCSGGQVQFMMSASASSSSMTSSNVQSCSSTTILSNEAGVTSSSGSAAPRPTSTCNIPSDAKASCRYDTVPISGKRSSVPGNSDELKGASCCVGPLSSQQMLQPGRTGWPSTTTGLNCGSSSTFIERQLDPSYSSVYTAGNFMPGAAPSANGAFGFSDPAMSSRDLVIHQHSQAHNTCDLPDGSLPQVYTSSVLP
ncbi:unnamed protein product [Dicrocoelium dendriticum]|nr:unnamed protein product [Dicrocoelium dendriticum]